MNTSADFRRLQSQIDALHLSISQLVTERDKAKHDLFMHEERLNWRERGFDARLEDGPRELCPKFTEPPNFESAWLTGWNTADNELRLKAKVKELEEKLAQTVAAWRSEVNP